MLQEWEEEGATLRVVRFRIGVFKGDVDDVRIYSRALDGEEIKRLAARE